MSKNISENTPDRRVEFTLAELIRLVKGARQSQLKFLVIPVVTADPSSPTNGQMWYNSTENAFKGYENGGVVTFTTS